MNGPHVAEETLQQFAIDQSVATPETIAHIDACADCRAAAAAYQLLMEALKEQPAPVFSFDLAASVSAKLELKRSGQWWVAAVTVLIAAVPAWIFRKGAYFLFADVSAALSWLMAGAAAVVVLFSIYGYYRHYQKVLHLINN